MKSSSSRKKVYRSHKKLILTSLIKLCKSTFLNDLDKYATFKTKMLSYINKKIMIKEFREKNYEKIEDQKFIS